MPPVIVAGLLLVAAVVLVSTWTSWRARRRLVSRLRAEWGRARSIARNIKAVGDLFERERGTTVLDDRTAADLLIDDVFAWLDRTESRIGQQVLYRRLRSAPHALDAFEALVSRFKDDVALRERTQASLARLNDVSAYELHALAHPNALAERGWDVCYPLWSSTIVLALGLSFIWPKLLLAAVLGLAVNVGIRIATGRRVSREAASFRQVAPLLSVARSLATIGTADTAALTGTLPRDLAALRRVGAISRWVSRDPLTTPDILFAALEYLNMVLLLDVNALYFAARQLRSCGPHLLRVIHAVGEIDAAIAIASVRSGARRWTRPTFVPIDQPATLSNIAHPLLDEAVPNSIAFAPPHGVIVTGSNMSGKSTFLRTVGINVVLAQTVHTCLAATYEAPVYEVRSCIGRADDLPGGKSYYLAEVEAVVSLLRASDRQAPQLFIFDELFRGTNAVERIAAAEAVLDALVGNERPHVALIATHDAELVDLLHYKFIVYHLADTIGAGGLEFSYRLTPGPATSRNAIALLQLNGAPPSVVSRALARASALDRRRSRPTTENA